VTLEAKIVPLSRSLAFGRIDELVRLAAGGSGWTEANFMQELPEKWRWSLIALDDSSDAVLGFLVASRYAPRQVHTHELVVNQSARRTGVGRQLMKHLATEAAAVQEVDSLSLKVATDNAAALAFYSALGFRQDEEERGMFWMRRNNHG
jgi:ribosomal protein S18 acetylase RimI-like enzyme